MAQIKGSALNPNAGIQAEYSRAIARQMERMFKDAKAEIRRVFASFSTDSAMDGDGPNPAVQLRSAMNMLSRKWGPYFSRFAKKTSERMMQQTVKNSAVTLGMSLKDISASVTLETDLIDDRLREIITASTTEAANLIKLIPEQFLGQVQNAAMRSITTGNGLKDLIPYMNEKYGQNVRHARNVALDQTRKAYNNINAGRMKALGIKEYEWIHTGGSQHPRKEHIALNGKVFSLDAPPVIDSRTGEKGIPGQAVFCRCTMRPIVSFGED